MSGLTGYKGASMDNILFFLTPKAMCAFIYDDFSVRQALEKMESAGYTSLPILSKRGEYRGSLTEGDLLWALKNMCYMDMRQAEAHRISEITRRRNNLPVRVNTNMHDLVERAITQNFVPVVDDKDAFIGLQTRYTEIDHMLSGLGKSDLILIAARPGVGKTSFALNIAQNIALQKPKKTIAVFSLEMSNDQLANRMLSSEAQVDSYKLRSGQLEESDWDAIAYASSRLSEMEILIDDTPGITVTGMKSKLRRVKNLGMVVIDYLQLMQGDTRTDNRVNEVGEISRGLKLLAKELGVPVVTCAQLSRGPESRTDKRPMLSDLRDSGAIEQDADIVMFLYRDEYYNEDSGSQSVAEVIVAKNRHGSVDRVKLGWIGRYTKFTTLAKEAMME